MLRGDRFVRSTFGRPFTVGDYHKLHRLVAPVDDGDFGLSQRTGALDINFLAFNDSVSDLQSDMQSYVLKYSGTTVTLKAVSDSLSEVGKLLRAYYDKLFPTLNDIARLHQALENLHPYVDYNTRTNRIVLNRLLAETKRATLHPVQSTRRTPFDPGALGGGDRARPERMARDRTGATPWPRPDLDAVHRRLRIIRAERPVV
jgi:hypothetical protein